MREIITKAPSVTVQPAEEPITLTEAKLHLRVDYDEDDALIEALIMAARERAEGHMWRALITQTLNVRLDSWPCHEFLFLPRPRLQSVSSVQYTDDLGATATFASSNYIVSTASEPGVIALKDNAEWPTATLQVIDGISVTYVAGYGVAADVPAIIKQALLLTVGHWYENREDVLAGAGMSGAALPMAAMAIFDMFKVR